MIVEKGLVIREPWIDLLLSGQKTWEMRSTAPAFRGWIGLIRKGSGCVSAVAQMADVGARMSPAQMLTTFDRHRIPAQMIESGEVAKWCIPWIFANLRKLPRPVPYRHPSGAITLFNLDLDAQRGIAAQLEQDPLPHQPSTAAAAPPRAIASIPDAVAPKAAAPSLPAAPSPIPAAALGPNTLLGEVEITEGNLTNNHFYLRSFLHRFPSDLVGGRDLPHPRLALVEAAEMQPANTDICPRHRFFRDRSWTRRFFETVDAAPGDVVQVSELAPYRYAVSLKKARL